MTQQDCQCPVKLTRNTQDFRGWLMLSVTLFAVVAGAYAQPLWVSNVSIGGGTPLLFGFDDGDRPFWITPKVQIVKSSSTDVAVGVFQVFNGAGDGGGVAYAVSTSGTARGSFTIGGGMAYGNSGGRSGMVMVGGERQVRRNLKLMSENYLWKDGNGVASAGVRFFGERLSADLALGFPIGSDEFFAFPIVNFVYLF